MATLVDSHCHLDRLDLSQHQGDLQQALAAAQANDVKHFLCVCIDLDHFQDVMTIAEQFEQVHASVGVHPTEQSQNEVSVSQLTRLANHPKVVAIGETGLDYYRCEQDNTWQQARFRVHIQAAKASNKPLIIHSRQARADTIAILQEENAQEVRGVMHCFTETWEMAEQAMALGFYISFSGIITFKNARELQALAKQVPLERMLIETDSPYLAPVPYRGKSNEPAYVRYVAEQIAALRDISYEKVAEQTTKNYFDLFIDR